MRVLRRLGRERGGGQCGRSGRSVFRMSWQFTTTADGNVVDMLKTAQAQVGMDEDE